MPLTPCPSCEDASLGDDVVAQEMMFGLGGPFRYRRCPACGCLHLLDAPDDLSLYYPPGYYSFGGAPETAGGLKHALKRARTMALLAAPALVPRHRPAGVPAWARWFRSMRLSRRSRILDVGCGWGENLAYLQRDGFTHLAGIDAFLPEPEIDHGGGLVVRRGELIDAGDGWDLVMLHHSFEHMADPQAVLRSLRTIMRPGGWVLLRTPVADSWAARTYGANWVALDAPRHLVVHTPRSIDALCGAGGFTRVDTFWDSWSFQLWGSEQYRAGVYLLDPRSHAVDPSTSMFSDGQLRDFERRADELNRAGEGDQAGFVLQTS